ncbi:putative ABC-type cobalt transport system, ATPase component [Methanocella conradii HZ254]|uniref:ABC-type cobalt transport system, ATPase component n=1 Tax=Methanocella conradii (strain DSM 24694 / JCM 17849 / CGMCC 1.5162 / HZ254) TaxID=1041930 RepID=H8I4G7_METCZ|nr:ATP-binding cassette domain-containing protein [Methanocella conradii]AFD00146.1 putative ABC-type cobalt transport system, ATPase component [Methanocella conradii HZ254]MDI6896032.1 ATP-binding cassette domain-containing protein [Methanocella conradii]
MLHDSVQCAERSSDDIVHVDCVTHVYPDGSVGIHNMCFRVRASEVVAVCGGNASGKSTLLEHLNGLLVPSSGKVYVMGEEVNGGGKKDIWRHVGIVFQRPDDQLFAPTVLDDVMFGPLNMGVGLQEAKRMAMEALESVGVEGVLDKVPAYLSGGQKRLVAIAGVLAMRPKVIAMDEPTSDLDPFHSGLVERVIIDLKEKRGISVVLATHDVDLAARLADRVCILKKGCIIAEGPPRDIFYDRGLMNGAGLRIPKVAEIYLEHCAFFNKKPALKPLNVKELMEAMRGNSF